MSRRRLWAFRILAASVPLVLLLGLLECGLRLGGFGYPTSFFITQQIDGREYYVPNDRFALRFFPATIARTPYALRMPVEKGTNTYRIFLFGESAAQGDPDPTFGVGRYLEVLLRNRFPETDFQVVCVAMTAINSHAILPIARECGRLEGDMWVVYMGNNEMVGPYGAGTIFGRRSPPLPLVRASLALKTTKTGQLFDRIVERTRASDSSPKAWGGLNMFKQFRLRRDDPNRLQAYTNFAANLEAILQAGRKAGVPVLLSTVASNLKDCAPFASLHRRDLTEVEKAAWEQHFNTGIMREKAGEVAAALASFSNAAAMDPDFAELRFRMGNCELALSNWPAAKREYETARDCDALAVRADGAINQIITRAASRHESKGVTLLDASELLAANSEHGLTGEEFFYEHVHLNFAGNYLLAKLFAEQIAPQLPVRITSRDQGEWASSDFCDARLAVSLWDQHRLWQVNFSRVSEPPFTEQLDDVIRARRYMARLEKFRSQMTPAASEQARAMYRDALKAAPDDAGLHGNFAQLLGGLGEAAAAFDEQRRVCELLPQSPGAFQKAGLFLVQCNRMKEAVKCFNHAVHLRKDYVPALNELGLILVSQQRLAEGEARFQEAIRINPGYAESYINLGFSYQGANRMPEAMVQYRLAAQIQPEGPAAYFKQALEMASLGRSADAVKSFQAAIWMNPSFWQARYLLGLELAKAGTVEEAEAQFAEVVRLRPDFANAHLNLGVALAKRQKLKEALVEFQAALKINPTNESARQNIEKIQAVLRGVQ